jgi:hypothetical protein
MELQVWWRRSSLFKRWLIVNALIFAIVFGFAAQICMFSVASKRNLAGVVYGANDLPVAGAGVFASGLNGSGYAVTDSSGQYSISEGLKAGTYNVSVLAVGYVTNQTGNVQVTVGHTTSGINFDLQLSGGISGTVTDAVDGTPLGGVIVFAYETGGGTHKCVATTASDGTYLLATDLATGSYNVSVVFPEGHISSSSVQAVTAGAEVKNVNFALERSGIISGTVTAPGGEPLNNITVIASSISGAPYFGYALTNATGYYRITSGLATDTYTVMAISISGGIPTENFTTASVTAGLETSDVDIILPITPPSPSGIITGQVTDASSGKPIAYAEVDATGPGGYGSTTTDSNGNYAISSGLGTGTYNVTASALGYQDQLKTGVSVTVGSVTPGVNFQLSRIPSSQSGTITGTVTGASGAIPEFQYPTAVALSLTLVAAVASRLFVKTKRFKNMRALK